MSDSPLTKTDVANARNGCYECELCDRLIQQMKALGLDVAEEELRNEHLRRFFQGVVDQFGPLVVPSRPG